MAEQKPAPKQQPKVEQKIPAKTETKPAPKTEAKAPPKPAAKPAPTQRSEQAPAPRTGQAPKTEPKAPPKAAVKPEQKNVLAQKIQKKIEKKPPPKKILQRIADLKELAIAIDTFEDLFSDFDPRDYDKRDLSDDFLSEIKKRYRETRKGKFEVIFHAPKTLHDEKIEKIVVQRIKQHFRSNAKENQKDIAGLRVRGFFYIAFGVTLLTALTLLAYGKILTEFRLELLGVILLPLGWFGIWEGFSKIIDIPYKLSMDLETNQKLAKANYLFKFLE